MGRIINLDARKGGASTSGIVIGSVEAEPTVMRKSGSVLVLPYPEPFGLSNGKAELDLAPSPDGGSPAWAYKVTIRDEITGRSVTEYVAVPDGEGPISYTDLPRFSAGPGGGTPLFPSSPPRMRGSANGMNLDEMFDPIKHFGWWEVDVDGGAYPLPDGFTVPAGFTGKGRLEILGATEFSVVQRLTARWSGVTWDRTCVNTLTQKWTEWRSDRGRTSDLVELARRDSWLGLYDPTDENSITVTEGGKVFEIRDLLGNLPPLRADASAASVYPAYLKNEFGRMSGIGKGVMLSAFTSTIPQPLTVTVVARDEKYLGAQRAIFGSDGTGNRVQAGITATEDAYVGTSALIRSDEPIMPGAHIWESNFDETQTTLLVDSQLVKRGLPAGQTDGLSNLRVGANRRSSPTNVVYQWQGPIGALVVRKGIDLEANNRMRQAMRALTAIPEATPHFAPNVRAIDLDSMGRETIIWGDPDFVTTGSVASCTKVLNAVIVRKYVTDAMLDDEVTVLAEDEFIMNTPNLKDGDVVTYRELLYSMLVPSNNTAPRTLARAVGALISGDGDPTEKFIAAMQAQLDSWGFYGADIAGNPNPGGGLRMSVRQLALMMKHACEDSLLKGIMGTETHTVTITGPDARTVEVTNTFVSSNDYGRMDEWVASKDGTGTYTSCSVFIWRHPDGTEHIGAFQGAVVGQDRRFEEIGKLIEAARSGPRLDHRFIPTGGFESAGGPLPEPWGL